MAYLLPCPQCGRNLVVTTGEAGGRVRCECGSQVDVPTVRGLRELATAPAPTAEATSSWTARHSLIFLGVLTMLAGVAFGLFLHYRAARLLPQSTFADDIRNMPAEDTWTLWSQYFRGRVGRWQPLKGEKQLSDLKAYEEMKRWELIGYGFAGLGVVLAVIGLTMLGPKRPVPPKKRPPRRPVAGE